MRVIISTPNLFGTINHIMFVVICAYVQAKKKGFHLIEHKRTKLNVFQEIELAS